jgi:hypothetical protein
MYAIASAHCCAVVASTASSGSGTVPSTAMLCAGLTPQVTCGATAVPSIVTSRSALAAASVVRLRQ